MDKPIICVDFDGVIHSYERGWHNGQIYGTVVPGFFEWAERNMNEFKIVIYSSRSGDADMRRGMVTWLWFRFAEWCKSKNMEPSDDMFDEIFNFADEKPPAYLTIDDRAICFKGDWDAPELTTEAILNFKPWNRDV